MSQTILTKAKAKPKATLAAKSVKKPAKKSVKKALGLKVALLYNRHSPEASKVAIKLAERYQFSPALDAEIFVVVGGDGFMLSSIRRVISQAGTVLPKFFGLNRGREGFLLNNCSIDRLGARLAAAQPITLTPLKVVATLVDGSKAQGYAVNEISLLRHSPRTASLTIIIDGETKLKELRADGCLLATPAGSTGYNVSARGPVIPLTANLLALTPICPFVPKRWHGAILPESTTVTLRVKNHKTRPVTLACDNLEMGLIRSAQAKSDKTMQFQLLFDANAKLDERNINAQFAL